VENAPHANTVLGAVDVETSLGGALNDGMAACFPRHKVMDLTAAARNCRPEMSPCGVGTHAKLRGEVA